MASSRTLQQAQVGSAHWLIEETRLGEEYGKQEKEEFTYAVRNDIEWLNEYMSEVFNGREL